jgi:hypothetical protein
MNSVKNVKMFLILVSFLFLSLSFPVEGADWKLYAQNAPLEPGIQGNAYYDKDSIAYPFKTKGFFGMTEDKSIVSVWVKYTFPQQNREMKNLSYVSCKERQITIKSLIIDGQYIYPPQPFLDHPFGIEPNTTDEKLYNILCR